MEFKLRGEHVALCDVFKLTGIADSGGQGKLIASSNRLEPPGGKL